MGELFPTPSGAGQGAGHDARLDHVGQEAAAASAADRRGQDRDRRAHGDAAREAKGNRSAFTVPLISLIDQTVERFVENGIELGDIGVVQADHPLKRPHAPIQICSVQTLAKREFPVVDFIMVDESHIQHKVVYDWMDEEPDKIFVGLQRHALGSRNGACGGTSCWSRRRSRT